MYLALQPVLRIVVGEAEVQEAMRNTNNGRVHHCLYQNNMSFEYYSTTTNYSCISGI